MASKFDSVWVPTLQAAFLTGYENALNTWSLPCTRRYDSPGEFLKLADVGTVGKVRQLDGKPLFQSPRIYTETLQNVPYYIALPIDVEDYNRDSIGIWDAKASEMGGKFGDHINALNIQNLLSNPTCFDGQPFFGSTHPVNNTTQTNDLTSLQVAPLATESYNVSGAPSTPTAPSILNMAFAILGACAYFYNLVDEVGDPLNFGASEFEILTGNYQIYTAVIGAINSMQLNQGQTNPLYAGKENPTYQGLNTKSWRFLPAFDPRLGNTSSTIFYVFRTDSEVKPLAWSEEKGLDVSFIGPGSEMEKTNNTYMMYAKAVRAVAVGRYQHALRCTLS